MSDENPKRKTMFASPLFWAIIATMAMVVFGLWAANQEVCAVDFWGNKTCDLTKWEAFVQASPNEVGDTLAGFAGALAFVWLIATVVLQGQELREQRQEFKKMAEAQDKQAKIFEKEQKFREAQAADYTMDQVLRTISLLVLEMYEYASPIVRILEDFDPEEEKKRVKNGELETVIPELVKRLESDLSFFCNPPENSRSAISEIVGQAAGYYTQIFPVEEKLSGAKQIWLVNNGAKELEGQLLLIRHELAKENK